MATTSTSNKVMYKYGTQAQYDALQTKESNVLYVIIDTHRIYKGSDIIASKDFIFTDEEPTPGNMISDVLYLYKNPKTGDIRLCIKDSSDSVINLIDGSPVTPNSAQELTNKTIDGTKNNIINLPITSISSEVIATTVNSENASNDKLVTEKAVSDAIKNSGAYCNVKYDTSGESNNKLVFTKLDGTTKEVDIAKDNFLSSAKLNTETKELELTMSDGSVVKIPVSDLMVTELDSDHIVLAEDITFKGQTLGSYTDNSIAAKGTILTEVLKKMAAKQIPPTYTAPTISVTPSNKSVETGTKVTPSINTTYTQNDGGAVTSYSVTRKLSGVSESIQSGDTIQAVTDSEQVVPDGSNLQYTVNVGYAAGAIKNDNLGSPYPNTSIKAGTLSRTVTYTGQRKRFHSTGSGSLPDLTSDNIRAMTGVINPTAGSTFNISVSVGEKYVVIAIPKPRSIKEIMYVETNDTGMLPNFNQSVVSVADARGGTNGLAEYNVYTYEMAGAAQASMTFKVTLQ